MLKVNPNMKYNNIGNSGLIISCLSFGNASNQGLSHEQNKDIVAKCLQLGINSFDTAQIYWNGKAEESLGKIFKELLVPRDNIVVSTKILTSPDPSINSTLSTNRKHVRESIKGSLARLQMQYVDIIYAHLLDDLTPMEEICRSFHDIIQEGYAFYWSVSNWEAESVFRALEVCEKYNLHKPICSQIHYNMMIRDKGQSQYEKLLKNYKFGMIAYNTLLGGYLTGKYLEPEAQGRFSLGIPQKKIDKSFWKNSYFDYIDFESLDEKLKKLKIIAQSQLECELTHLAIAWSLKYQYLSSAIIGARNPSQIQNSVECFKVLEKLSPQIEGKINKILDTHPPSKFNFKSFSERPHLRYLQK